MPSTARHRSIFLIAATLVDVLTTTLLLKTGGPFSLHLAHALWELLLAVHRRRSAHRLLELGGVIILLLTFSVRFLLFRVGWNFPDG